MIRRRVSLTLAIGLLLLSSACSAASGLQSRAAAYYNFMAGLSPKIPYSSFLSPEYRKTFKRSDLDQLNKTYAKASKPTERYKPCKPGDVSVAIVRGFALSVPDPELGDAFRNLKPVRWVRTGMRWSLYTGSSAEVKKYGEFPTDIIVPRPDLEKAENQAK